MGALLFRLSLPLLTGMFFQLFYSVVDTWFIGQIDLNDPSYVGSTGLAWPVIFFFIAIGNGLMVGMSSFVARALGEGNREVLNRVIESGIAVAALASVITLIGFFAAVRPLLIFMGAEGILFERGMGYLTFILPLGVLMYFGNTFAGILQGEGSMKVVMHSMILGNVVNLVLDPLFIFSLGLDVRGAALATNIGQFCALVYVLLVFKRSQGEIRIHWDWKNISRKVMAQIISVGLPQTISMILVAFGFVFINRLVVRIDELGLTAGALYGRVEQMLMMPTWALSGAVVTIVGQNGSRGLYDRVWDCQKQVWLWGSLVVLVLAGLLQLIGPPIFGLFSNVRAVLDYAVLQSRVMLLFYAPFLVSISNSSFYQGTGHPKLAFVITTLRAFVIPVSMAHLNVLIFNMGLPGIWLGFGLGWSLSAFLGVLMVRRSVARMREGKFQVGRTA